MIQQRTSPIKVYEQYVKEGGLQDDPAQRMVAGYFQILYDALATKPKRRIINKIIPLHDKTSLRGMYVWGDVGRGKSLLMDIFLESAPITAKQRIHFHSLMLDIHKNIHTLRQKKVTDPLKAVAMDIAKKTRLLCIDEFQVTDVADAMILKKLFAILLKENVLVVITSNRPPKELYMGGLQREKFLDFVKLVNERMDVLELDSPHDYRTKKIKALKSVYLTPLNKKNGDELQHIFINLTNSAPVSKMILEVQGRKVQATETVGHIARFSFTELCGKPLGAADYLAIAKQFDTVFICNIPLLSPENRNEARRFVTLIDTLYDNKVKLICTAAATPEKLYQDGDGSFEFQRTVSRLLEMQSAQYIDNR